METKICSKCKEEKSASEFSKDKYKKDGLCFRCKKCLKQDRQENRKKISEDKKQYYQNNKKKIKQYQKQYRQNNKEKIDVYQNNWKKENKQKIKQYNKEYMNKWYYDNKEKIKQYHQNNKEKIKTWRKQYRKTKKYKDWWRVKRRILQRKKIKTDPRFKLDNYFSRYIRTALLDVGSSKKGRSWESLVGYNASQLKEHLEKQFKPEMNWDNHGTYWHIDHIKPKSWFKYDSAEHPEFKKCWALENLQPLEAKINILKSNKYEG